MVDHYAELGVAPTADRAEIRRAWAARAREVHPDPGAFRDGSSVDPNVVRRAEDRLMRCNEAYAVLSDPERRAAYDRSRRLPPAPQPGRWFADGRADPGFRPHPSYSTDPGAGSDFESGFDSDFEGAGRFGQDDDIGGAPGPFAGCGLAVLVPVLAMAGVAALVIGLWTGQRAVTAAGVGATLAGLGGLVVLSLVAMTASGDRSGGPG